MAKPDLSLAIGLPPKEAIAYFEAKGLRLSGDWRELWKAQHAKAFTVAHLAKLDVLQDLRDGISTALKEGRTEYDFVKELTPILQKKGWWGPAIDPVTGVLYRDPKTGKDKIMLPDAGWDYNPGKAAYGTPEFLDDPPDTRTLWPGRACLSAGCEKPGDPPAPRVFDASLLLPKGREDAYYIGAFLEMFGVGMGESRIFTDVTGEPLRIGADLFTDTVKTLQAGRPIYKLAKDERRRAHMRMLAQTLIDPQEIWQGLEVMMAKERAGEIVDRRRYMAWWLVEGEDRPGLSVFEYAPAKYWTGVTVFAPHDKPAASAVDYMEGQRTGRRVWPKK